MKPSRSVLTSMFVSVLLISPVTIPQAQESPVPPARREGLAGIGFGEMPVPVYSCSNRLKEYRTRRTRNPSRPKRWQMARTFIGNSDRCG